MATVGEIAAFLAELAPPSLKMDFDNVGLLAGTAGTPVARVLLSLDITDEVIREAEDLDAELIVSHHPLFFDGLKSVNDLAPHSPAAKVTELLGHGLSAVCMHTNLDAAQGGVNDALAAALGLRVLEVLNREEGVSRLCELRSAEPFPAFLARTCAALRAAGARYVDAGRPVRRVGVCGGAGGGDIPLACEAGCDTFVTADVKHHQFLQARELGINLIDAGHFPTENVVIPVLRGALAERFPELMAIISLRHRQPESFFVPEA